MIEKIMNLLNGHKDSPTAKSQNAADGDRQKDDDKATAPEPAVEESDVEQKVSARRRAKDFLAEYGIKEIKSQDDVNKIFWEMATRRRPITNDIANAVHIVICDNRLMISFNRKMELYNRFMDFKFSDPEFMDERRKMKAMMKAHKEEVIKLNQAVNREVREKNVIKQKLIEETGVNRKFATRVMNQLKTHQGRFLRAYDFTKEHDVVEFLSWYKILKRPVSSRTINSILKHHIEDSESSGLFQSLVEKHNAQYQSGYEDDETE